MTCEMQPRKVTLFCPFGGGGGGAKGGQDARAELFGRPAVVELLGGIDNSKRACLDFEYLTGVPQTHADVGALTPADLREIVGPRAPDIAFSSPPCLPATGLVLTDAGSRQIQTIRAGDKVLTHRGRYRRVLAVGAERFVGPMLRFRLNGTVDWQEFTPEHPMFVRRIHRPVIDGRQQKRWWPATFLPAREVRVGDRIGFPVDTEEQGCAERFVRNLSDPRVVVRGGKTKGRYRKPEHVAADVRTIDLRSFAESDDLWFLAGVYLGDGYRRRKALRHNVIFCVGADNGDLAKRVRAATARLGLSCRTDRGGGETNVKLVVPSKHLCEFMGWFGDGCARKEIPLALMSLEERFIRALVDGYRSSDGSDEAGRRGEDVGRWGVPSVGLQLLRSFQRLLLRLHIYGGINVTAHAGQQQIEGRTVNTSDRWSIRVQEVRKKTTSCFFEDGMAWIRVGQIEQRQTDEMVWNLEVEEDNTFCAPLMTTHNCKPASKLLPAARAEEPKYKAMLQLAIVMTRLLLTTWDTPPPLLVYENVPNITSRARAMVAQIRKLLVAHGYAIQDGFHDCGDVGALGQRRKRWFFVARHQPQVPFFLYKPPRKGLRSCGSVLSTLPMPGAAAGGPMHELPSISAINWARLWAIPAGGDWRDLIQDGTPRRARFRRQHVERWVDPSVTIAGSGSNGPYGVQDPRPGEAVRPPFEATGMLVQLGEDGAPLQPVPPPSSGFPGAYGVLDEAEPAGAVTGNARIATGAFSIAMKIDPTRHTNHYVVTATTEPVRCVTGATRPGNGAPSIADPIAHTPPSLVPQAGNGDMHYGKYNVLDPTLPAPPVTGATRVGSGAPSVADMSLLVPRKPAYDRAYSVLDPKEPSPVVAAKSYVGCGGYAIPTSVLPLKCEQRAGSYGVLDPTAPAKTIVAHMQVDNSPAAVATPALPPGYGVLPYEEAKKIATGEIRAPFMVVDRSDPTTPLAIVDRLDRAPYRWIEVPSKRKGRAPKRKKVHVPLVMISADGTWHRPLTTLELAGLQGLPCVHKGAPLCFSGGSTNQRETIGNMVPPPAAAAIIGQMLLCLLAADSGCFYLDSGGQGVWCRPEDRERLAREGVRIVHASKPWKIGSARVLDDGAVVRAKPRAAKGRVAKPRSRPPRGDARRLAA